MEKGDRTEKGESGNETGGPETGTDPKRGPETGTQLVSPAPIRRRRRPGPDGHHPPDRRAGIGPDRVGLGLAGPGMEAESERHGRGIGSDMTGRGYDGKGRK